MPDESDQPATKADLAVVKSRSDTRNIKQTMSAKDDIERRLEVMAAYAKKWERSRQYRDIVLQNNRLFQSFSPESQARVRSALDELDALRLREAAP